MRPALAVLLARLPASADGIVPLDGTWETVVAGDHVVEDCPDAMRPLLDDMLTVPSDIEPLEVDWPDALDPAVLFADDEWAGLPWTRHDPDVWTADILDPGGGATVVGTIRLEPLAPDRIAMTTTFDLVAAMIGAGASGTDACRVTVEALATLAE